MEAISIEMWISEKAQSVLAYASENNIKHADALETLYPGISIENKLRVIQKATELWLTAKIEGRRSPK